MKSLSLLAGAGLASFLVFLVVSLPAKVLTDLAAPAGVQIAGATGSAWRGEARSVEVPGFQLGRTTWIIDPAAFVLGRLSATIETVWPGGKASGKLTVGITGSIRLREFEAVGSVAPIAQQMNLPPSGGQFFIDIADLVLVDNWPRILIADVRVENVPLALMGVAGAPAGSYRVSFASEEVTDDGLIIGELKDLSGPLIINGKVTLSPPMNYEIVSQIGARPDAPSDLVQGLALLGPPGPDGAREFTMAGSF